MSVRRDHAERIAHLARLRFGEAELERITAELNHILDYVESLKEALPARGEGAPGGADGSAVAGGAPTVVDCASTRSAGAEEPDALGRPLDGLAPDWRDGFFVVPPLPGVHGGEDA